MRKKIIVSVFVLLLLGCSIGELVSKKASFSEKENRYLQSWPSFTMDKLLNGSYVKQLEDYLTDHFVFRDQWISLNTTYNKVTLKDEVNGVYLCQDDYLIEKYQPISRADLIYRSINAFVDNNPDVKVEVMFVPTSIVINQDKLPDNIVDTNQADDLKLIYQNLNCQYIDLTQQLKKANEIKDVYYHLDHHWTTYGAYTAYLAYCNANGLQAHQESDYNIKLVSNNFTGTIYSKVGDYSLDKDEIYKYSLVDEDYVFTYGDTVSNTVYDRSYLETNDQYAYFLSSNHPLATIVNNNSDSDEQLLIIKDSYANCFVPFLIDHYSKITLIDPRYYGLSIHNYLIENNITNVLFLYNMNTIGNDVGIRGIE